MIDRAKITTKNYFRNIYDTFLRKKIKRCFEKGSSAGLMPAQLAIETSALCNAECIMCPHGRMTRPKGIMTTEMHSLIMDKMAEWAPPISVISHAGMGEPLLDKGLADKIRYEKKAFPGASVEVFTNGELLDGERVREFMEAGVNTISISINASRPDTHKKVTNTLSYGKVTNNIMKAITIRNAAGSKMKIHVSLIPLALHSPEEIREFKVFWRGKADAVVVPPWISWGGFFPHSSGQDQWPCRHISNVFMVDWNGIVKMCCEDYDTQFPVGDITRENPRDIFNSFRMQKQRSEQARGCFAYPAMCLHCVETEDAAREFWAANKPVTSIK